MKPDQNAVADHNLISLESHILREEATHPGSTGDFTWILSALCRSGVDLLQITPTTIHERVSAMLGSPEEVALVLDHLAAETRASQG